MRRSVKITALSGVSLVVAVTAYVFYFAQPGVDELSTLSSEAPRSVLGIATIRDVDEVYDETVPLLEDVARLNPDIMRTYREILREIKSVVGADITDPQDLQAELGIDLSSPITFALMEVDGNRGPRGFVLGLTVTDIEAVESAAKRVAKKKSMDFDEDKDDGMTFFEGRGAGEAFAVSVAGDRGHLMIFLMRPSDIKSTDDWEPADELRDYLKDSEKKPLSERKAWTETVSHMTGRGGLAVFAHLSELSSAVPSRDSVPLLDDLVGAGVVAGENELSACLVLDDKSDLLDYLETGSNCREFIAKADKPALAICLSVKQPFELFREFLSSIEPKRAERMFSDEETLKHFGLDYDEMCELLKDGSAGMLFYAGPKYDKWDPLVPLAFYSVSDRDDAESIINKAWSKLQEDSSFPVTSKREHGDNIVIVSETSWGRRTAIALIDDYIVVGKAVREVRRLAEGDADGWEPSCGTGALCDFQINFAELIELFSDRYDDIADDDLTDVAEAFWGQDGRIVGQISANGNVLTGNARIENTSFGPVGSKLIASLIWAGVIDKWERGLSDQLDESRRSVSGTVVYNGKPLSSGRLRTMVLDGDGKEGSSTRIGSDGKFIFDDYDRLHGGVHKVIVSDNSDVPEKYTSYATTPLTIDVDSDTETVYLNIK